MAAVLYRPGDPGAGNGILDTRVFLLDGHSEGRTTMPIRHHPGSRWRQRCESPRFAVWLRGGPAGGVGVRS